MIFCIFCQNVLTLIVGYVLKSLQEDTMPKLNDFEILSNGPFCLKDGTPVYKDFEESTPTAFHGIYFRNGLRFVDTWDKFGNSLKSVRIYNTVAQ